MTSHTTRTDQLLQTIQQLQVTVAKLKAEAALKRNAVKLGQVSYALGGLAAVYVLGKDAPEFLTMQDLSLMASDNELGADELTQWRKFVIFMERKGLLMRDVSIGTYILSAQPALAAAHGTTPEMAAITVEQLKEMANALGRRNSPPVLKMIDFLQQMVGSESPLLVADVDVTKLVDSELTDPGHIEY